MAYVMATMKASFDHLRAVAIATSDAESDAKASMFGWTMTNERSFCMIAEHVGEHLGQSIAYARANGIVAPWSAKGGM